MRERQKKQKERHWKGEREGLKEKRQIETESDGEQRFGEKKNE